MPIDWDNNWRYQHALKAVVRVPGASNHYALGTVPLMSDRPDEPPLLSPMTSGLYAAWPLHEAYPVIPSTFVLSFPSVGDYSDAFEWIRGTTWKAHNNYDWDFFEPVRHWTNGMQRYRVFASELPDGFSIVWYWARRYWREYWPPFYVHFSVVGWWLQVNCLYDGDIYDDKRWIRWGHGIPATGGEQPAYHCNPWMCSGTTQTLIDKPYAGVAAGDTCEFPDVSPAEEWIEVLDYEMGVQHCDWQASVPL